MTPDDFSSILPAGILAQIAREARAACPRECCGLLLGANGCIEAAIPITNIALDPLTFELDPLEYAAAERAARLRGRALIGYYHSHVAGPPVPSRRDLASLVWTGAAAGHHL